MIFLAGGAVGAFVAGTAVGAGALVGTTAVGATAVGWAAGALVGGTGVAVGAAQAVSSMERTTTMLSRTNIFFIATPPSLGVSGLNGRFRTAGSSRCFSKRRS